MTKSLKLLSVAVVLAALLCAPLRAQSNNHAAARLSPAEVEKWRQDLRYLAEEMPRRHKNLFHAMTREQFEAAVKLLDERVPTLARYQVIVELERIVAMVGDGHTGIQGLAFDSKIGFHSYPLTLYIYKDGLFVQSADPKYAEAIGARVVKIGNATAEEALRAVHDLVFHDNEQAIKAFTPIVVTTPEVLQTLGLINEMESAPFVFERDGRQFTLDLKPMSRPVPIGLGTNFIKLPGWVDARDKAPGQTPLYLKDPENFYWFEYLPEAKTIYVQYNAVANKPDESIADFTKRLFAFVDSHAVERFVLDMRNNGGGNNALNHPLLLAILKSKIDERGRLFTIIGRGTFSAAQNFINELDRYTNTLFVGEPTGQNVNFYGDPVRIELPNSGIGVRISSLWWQDMDPRDRRQWTAPQLAAELTSEDYRANTDPAMKAILAYTRKKPLAETMMDALQANDVGLAKKLFVEYRNDPANAYVSPEATVNTLGYTLIQQKRIEQAIEVFKLNVEAFPQSANVYDSLGEAYLNAGNNELAIKNYEKAFELDPTNTNAAQVVKRLKGK